MGAPPPLVVPILSLPSHRVQNVRVVFRFDDHAPPGPDGARGCERSVLTERELVYGTAEVADACYYDTPLYSALVAILGADR
jgi:hypothetical protein